jgi:hypothetical protein
MAYVPTCVFRLHQRLVLSEWLCEAATEDEAVCALTLPASPQRLRFCPFRLAVGDGLTVMSSAAEFDPSSTRCHLTLVDAGEVQEKWLRAIIFAVRSVSGQAKRFGISSFACHRACPQIIGVLCVRDTSASFSVGLITQGSRSQVLRTTTLQDWHADVMDGRIAGASAATDLPTPALPEAGQPPPSMMFAELPVCAVHRKAKVSVWWHSVRERIVPEAVLPPILVQCHVPCADSASVFGAVRVFLIRPATGELHGTSQRRFLSLISSHSAGASSSLTSNALNSRSATCLGDVTNAASTEKKQLCPPVASSASTARPQFIFDDLRISSVGEHFLCAEVTVSQEYVPFVSPLTYSIPPFRVIDPAVG